MNYGFIIDNRKCIGCHACSTACKAENEVPLSVNRTWVKYVETGAYPDSTRHFQVNRCNHCENPPCTRICPVTAMYQREDGIVEFDPEVCIGCKACMQACPYDAIYIDPETNAAAKCHYCAHRIDVDLEPACVVVCPEHAIIAGDMDDSSTEISRMLAQHKVTVRKPEQGTTPNLFYINGSDVSLHPTATERNPDSFMWSDVIPLHSQTAHSGESHGDGGLLARMAEGGFPATHTNGHSNGSNGNGHIDGPSGKTAASGATLRSPQPQGHSWNGPIQIGEGRMAEQMVQVAYNAQHYVPWHWPVPAYLVTKGIGAGIFMLLSLLWGLGIMAVDPLVAVVGGFFSLLFIGITTALLVYDLEKPEMFLTILTRPQWRSWLTRGAFILIGFTVVAGLWWLLETIAYFGDGEMNGAARFVLLWLGFALAVGTAIYTAFLFGQAEGRDLWQSTLLPIHLIIQAFMVGSGMMLVLDLLMPMAEGLTNAIAITFIVSLIVDLAVTFMGEFGMPHASEIAAKAAHDISHGKYKNHFWKGSILIGHAVPLLLMGAGVALGPVAPLFGAVAAIAAMIGLYCFEYAFVMAPQDISNS